jgi:hypothetical protein
MEAPDRIPCCSGKRGAIVNSDTALRATFPLLFFLDLEFHRCAS